MKHLNTFLLSASLALILPIAGSFSFSDYLPASVSNSAFAKGFKAPERPDEVHFTISGRVVKEGKPIKGCEITLFEPGGELAMSGKTADDGEFSFKHKETTARLTLEVMPPEKLECAQSIVEKLPGSANRNLIIELHKGFLISGRVLFRQSGRKDVGLKGLVVKAEPLDSGLDGRAQVHGAGYCVTEKNGVFALRLTEGKKRITFINNKNSESPVSLSRDVDVNSDKHLGAIIFQ